MTAVLARVVRWFRGDLASMTTHRIRTEALARTINTRPKAHQ